MRIILGIAAFLHVVLAQSINETYLAGLGKALNDSGLIELSTIAVGISDTTDGARLLNILPTKNFTIFAPDDDACRYLVCICTLLSNDLASKQSTRSQIVLGTTQLSSETFFRIM